MLPQPPRNGSDPASFDHISESSKPEQVTHRKHYMIYMIPGNPGLIQYYKSFLATLSLVLSSASTPFSIEGHSLAGFECSTSSYITPHNLEQQVLHVESRIETSIKQTQNSSANRCTDPTGQSPTKVILIGHSVGSYILLEILRRHRQSSQTRFFEIVGGILLFPTVTHIARSPSGLKLSKVIQIPYLPHIVGSFARVAAAIIPTKVLVWLIKTVTKFPEDAARTTWRFLQRSLGVREALYLARDEMKTITEDAWDDEVWGAATSPATSVLVSRPKLIFYFGQNDHWVADHTRDELIAARASMPPEDGLLREDKPQMMIDQDHVPHGFCIKHSEMVAEKVQGWVEEIVDHDMTKKSS
ncbi:MAG: hypothetical protein M1833_000139 [Piccolia ochrophora]|nr:MAG: hypothetical protein M1833_000139 [Piccolia ochrophora]